MGRAPKNPDAPKTVKEERALFTYLKKYVDENSKTWKDFAKKANPIKDDKDVINLMVQCFNATPIKTQTVKTYSIEVKKEEKKEEAKTE